MVEPGLIFAVDHSGDGEGDDKTKRFVIAMREIFAGKIVTRRYVVRVVAGGFADPSVDPLKKNCCAGISMGEVIGGDPPGYAAGIEIIHSIIA